MQLPGSMLWRAAFPLKRHPLFWRMSTAPIVLLSASGCSGGVLDPQGPVGLAARRYVESGYFRSRDWHMSRFGIRLPPMPIFIITEKTSQARDLRAALGERFGQILPAEGHLLRLAEPHEVEASWKSG